VQLRCCAPSGLAPLARDISASRGARSRGRGTISGRVGHRSPLQKETDQRADLASVLSEEELKSNVAADDPHAKIRTYIIYNGRESSARTSLTSVTPSARQGTMTSGLLLSSETRAPRATTKAGFPASTSRSKGWRHPASRAPFGATTPCGIGARRGTA
jgi:hypothetical protein